MRSVRARLLILVLLMMSALACRRHDPPPPKPAPDLAALTPMGAARQLYALHLRKAYGELAHCIVPQSRELTTNFVRVIDDVLSANESLRSLAENQYKGPVAECWSLGPIADNLGIFSQRVTFLSEEYVGDRAYVTLQEADHVPLVHAEFVWGDGRWLYRPEPLPQSAPAEFLQLASILRDLRGQVQSGQSVVEFVMAFESRIIPQIRRIASLHDVKVAEGAGEF